ncbi:hypothetical protein [Lacticaseibacillus mingshuiensis]|uniref:hypothetical protein n=1 Tax=Lacticaseibacillus mingshuiensis TaxID=2799574 RepID=UPI00194245D1|nr:hypothetical protein [Lacticaseibacillus mingshuiensis]
MSDLELIEDMYPNLRFYGIEVDDPAYHGHICGQDVYINTLQDDLDWLITALHEAAHSENDQGDLSDGRSIITLRAEGWAVREAMANYLKMFG